MDGWKSKGVCRKSFAGLMCRWVSESWQIEEVCLGIPEMASRKRAVDLQTTASAEMEAMGVAREDAISFTTDHEGAQRKAVRGLADVAVGCACHGIQLPPRHSLPLVKQRAKSKATSEPDSASTNNDDSSDSGKADDDVPAEEAGDAEGNVDPHVKERFAIRAALDPLFAKARVLVKWFIRNHDVYNEYGTVCSEQGWPWKRFARETATRFSSQLDMLVRFCTIREARSWLVQR